MKEYESMIVGEESGRPPVQSLDASETPPNNHGSNLTPEADRFFAEANRYHAFSGLNFRTARIIDIYIGTAASYADLAEITGVTPARIGQVILKGINRLLFGLPDEVREQFQKERPLKIKAGISEAARAKMKGRHHSEATRTKMSEAQKGRTVSEATRTKMSEAQKGRVSPMKGRHLSEAARAKMKGRHLSEATRAKMSEAKKGRVSPMKGRHLSEATRAKMSEARKGYWKNKKATENNN